MDSEEIKYALDNRTSLPPENITAEMLREAGCLERVCVLPRDFRERMSYLANVLVQGISGDTVNDDRLRHTVGQLAQSLCYMMNSASWMDGELHDFDAMKLQENLGRFIRSR
jgi:hypothetical protein